MSLTYSDSNASIYSSDWFKGRVRVATSTYVNYLLNTPVEDPEYAEKIALAQRMTQQFEFIIAQLMFTLSGDAEVQVAGPSITDSQLQMIVEKTLQKYYPLVTTPAIGTGSFPPPIHPPAFN